MQGLEKITSQNCVCWYLIWHNIPLNVALLCKNANPKPADFADCQNQGFRVYPGPRFFKIQVAIPNGQCVPKVTSQPQSITTPWSVSNNTAWWQKHGDANKLLRGFIWQWNGSLENQTFRSQTQCYDQWATKPPWYCAIKANAETWQRQSAIPVDDTVRH